MPAQIKKISVARQKNKSAAIDEHLVVSHGDHCMVFHYTQNVTDRQTNVQYGNADKQEDPSDQARPDPSLSRTAQNADDTRQQARPNVLSSTAWCTCTRRQFGIQRFQREIYPSQICNANYRNFIPHDHNRTARILSVKCNIMNLVNC